MITISPINAEETKNPAHLDVLKMSSVPDGMYAVTFEIKGNGVKTEFGITLLALSFALNASLLLQAHKQRGIDRAESNSAPIVLHRKPSRNYDQWLSADAGIVSESLQKADLTREESQNLAILMINERFQEKEGALLRIDDPWLTLDEIYDEGTARIEALREAELERRPARQPIDETNGGS